MALPDIRIKPLGKHSLHIDGDSLEVIARGPITAEDMEGLLECFMQIKSVHGHLFVLYDGRESTGIEQRARSMVSKFRHDQTDADLRVAFGVSFGVRVMLSMVVRAQKVLLNRDINIRLFDGEKEARAYFEAERARMRQQFKK